MKTLLHIAQSGDRRQWTSANFAFFKLAVNLNLLKRMAKLVLFGIFSSVLDMISMCYLTEREALTLIAAFAPTYMFFYIEVNMPEL